MAALQARFFGATSAPDQPRPWSCHLFGTASWRSAKIVQERLGHANVAQTLQVYSHVLPGMSEEAAEVIAEQVFG